MAEGHEHNPELESLAAFRYQGMTIEQLLISLAIKQDQTLTAIFEMRKDMTDLKERKADKTEFTSFMTMLNNLDTKVEKYKNATDARQKTVDDIITEMRGGLKAFKVLVGVFGVVWPIIMLVANHYWK